MRRTIVLAVVAAAALALGVGQAPARSYPTAVENLAGHWQGFFQSDITGEIGTFTLDMTAGHNRQLDGTLNSPTLPMSLPFQVTVGASGVFTAVSPGGNFVVHGMAKSTQGFGMWEVGRYRLLRPRPNEMTDIGTLTFFKSFPGEGAGQLPAALEGTFERDDGQTGRILIGIHWRFDSDFRGVAMFGDISFPFLGSIGEADERGIAPVRALSVSPFGTLLIKGNWVLDQTRPPHLDGMVWIILGDGSVRTASFVLVRDPRPGGI
jgi:hypothetical protein